MSIHSNLSLLLENIDNPEVFNLYLENSNDIIENIIKTNNKSYLDKLRYASEKYYDEDYKVFESKIKHFIKLLFKENKMNDIFLYCIHNIRKEYLQYFVKHINKFNDNDRDHIKWLLKKLSDNKIEIIDNHEKKEYLYSDESLNKQIFDMYQTIYNQRIDLFEIKYKLYRINRVQDLEEPKSYNNIFIRPYRLKNIVTKKYYKEWKINLLSSELFYIFE